MDIKSVVANNIVELRKSRNWTQAELAQKLSYSDKAVSKWERAESLPDVVVLKGIADLFLVTVDYLLEEQHNQDPTLPLQVTRLKKENHIVITLISVSLVLLLATILFVYIGIFSVKHPMWMAYVYAIPVICVVLIIFNSIWGKRVWNFIFISILVWSILLTLYLSLSIEKFWMIFIIGIPAQIIILLWRKLKYKLK